MADPNAPGPDALSTELTNIMVAHSGGKVSRQKCETIVDLQMTKLMEYYAAQAEPEVTVDVMQLMQAAEGLREVASVVISMGAKFTTFMSEQEVARWQMNAARLRGKTEQIVELIT